MFNARLLSPSRKTSRSHWEKLFLPQIDEKVSSIYFYNKIEEPRKIWKNKMFIYIPFPHPCYDVNNSIHIKENTKQEIWMANWINFMIFHFYVVCRLSDSAGKKCHTERFSGITASLVRRILCQSTSLCSPMATWRTNLHSWQPIWVWCTRLWSDCK